MASKAEIRFPHGPKTGAGAGAGGSGSGTPGSSRRPARLAKSSGVSDRLFRTSRGAPAFAKTRAAAGAPKQARCSAVSPSSFCQPSVRRPFASFSSSSTHAFVEASGTPCRG